MKKLILLIVFSAAVSALPPAPAYKQESVVYHNANIHVGNGQYLPNATIAFENGKITRVGYFKMAWKPTDIDLKGKHVYPGFILPVTNLGLTEIGAVKATKDDAETGLINPNIRSISAYNTDSEITPTLRFNGILLAQVTPQGGLVSGLSSIVQLDAWNWEDATVVADDALHINWPNHVQNRFDFSTFTMKKEENKEFQTQVNSIKSLFIDAKNTANSKSQSDNLKLKAVEPVFTSSRKVYVHTDNPVAIIESITFLQEAGVKNIVLVAGQGVEPVIDFLKKSDVSVIVNGVHKLPDRSDHSVDNGYITAIKLHKAGIPTALGYPSVMSGRNLAFTAGTLVGYGMEKEQALQMITSATAKILGIDKSYGTLETGKSATLIITEGDALDMKGNILTDAYIDGRKINLVGRQQELNKRYMEKYNL